MLAAVCVCRFLRVGQVCLDAPEAGWFRMAWFGVHGMSIPMKTQQRLALPLRGEPFFSELDPETVARVEGLVYHREYGFRQIIYFPDDPCNLVYWVRRGRVRITRVSGDGREVTFRHLLPGDLFGEECLTDLPRRECYAEAMKPTVLCLMHTEDFLRCLKQEPGMALRVARALCRRALDTEHVFTETVFLSVRSRVASALLRLYRREGAEQGGAISITHQEIANLIGSTRETTTATLHGLRAEGILTLSNRRIEITDPISLEQVARSDT